MVDWKYYPQYLYPSKTILEVVKQFSKNINEINSEENTLTSNEVLKVLRLDLEKLGFKIEKGKKKR